MNCDALNAERARLLAERDDLNTPRLSSVTDTKREAELTQLNGKLYTVAKAQFDKSCPLVANGRRARWCDSPPLSDSHRHPQLSPV